MTDREAEAIAAGAAIPTERGFALRPYLSTDAGSFRVGFWPDRGRGPVVYFGPAFPLTRSGQRSAQALAHAIERRLDNA